MSCLTDSAARQRELDTSKKFLTFFLFYWAKLIFSEYFELIVVPMSSSSSSSAKSRAIANSDNTDCMRQRIRHQSSKGFLRQKTIIFKPRMSVFPIELRYFCNILMYYHQGLMVRRCVVGFIGGNRNWKEKKGKKGLPRYAEPGFMISLYPLQKASCHFYCGSCLTDSKVAEGHRRFCVCETRTRHTYDHHQTRF